MHPKCHFHKIRCSREGNHTTVKTGKQEENTEPSTWTMSDLVSCLLLSKHISKSNAEFSNPPCSAPTGVLQRLASEPGQPPGPSRSALEEFFRAGMCMQQRPREAPYSPRIQNPCNSLHTTQAKPKDCKRTQLLAPSCFWNCAKPKDDRILTEWTVLLPTVTTARTKGQGAGHAPQRHPMLPAALQVSSPTSQGATCRSKHTEQPRAGVSMQPLPSKAASSLPRHIPHCTPPDTQL